MQVNSSLRNAPSSRTERTLSLPVDLDQSFVEIYERCKGATMTSVERMYALYKAIEYIVDANITGDLVECGVWRGGSVMLMAATLMAKRQTNRQIYLYDTFDGMVPPTERDRDLDDQSAESLLASASNRLGEQIWCLAPLAEVKANLAGIGYPTSNYVFVEGKVEETLPKMAPSRIALLRLDTDWYESTRQELVHLYPLLVKNGVLIVDDYGHWKGARLAVDEYFANEGPRILLNRVDYTGRIGIKN
jgi:O-methyltransferase